MSDYWFEPDSQPGQVFSRGYGPDHVFAWRSPHAIQIGTGATPTITIAGQDYPQGSGYVGIGTYEPCAPLDVSGELSPRMAITSSHPDGPCWCNTAWYSPGHPDSGCWQLWEPRKHIAPLTCLPSGEVRCDHALSVGRTESPSMRVGREPAEGETAMALAVMIDGVVRMYPVVVGKPGDDGMCPLSGRLT